MYGKGGGGLSSKGGAGMGGRGHVYREGGACVAVGCEFYLLSFHMFTLMCI